MNNTRRKQIAKVIEQLQALTEEISTLRDEEEEYRDNMPENLQGSQKYEDADTCVSQLEEALSSVENAVLELEGIE